MLALLLMSMLQPSEILVPQNPSNWITYADYPPALLRHGVQGDVTITISVNATGLPINCIIERSSGHVSLDSWTCNLMMKRAVFNPVSSLASVRVYRRKVAWRIPVDDPSRCHFRESTVPLMMTADTNLDGRVDRFEWASFVKLFSLKVPPEARQGVTDVLDRSFAADDLDHDGRLTRAELDAVADKVCKSAVPSVSEPKQP